MHVFAGGFVEFVEFAGRLQNYMYKQHSLTEVSSFANASCNDSNDNSVPPCNIHQCSFTENCGSKHFVKLPRTVHVPSKI